MTQTETTRLFIVGAGNRGQTYASYALEHPQLCSVVGVAEKRIKVLNTMAQKYNHTIQQELLFSDWKELQTLSDSQLNHVLSQIDAVVICLQDKFHYEATLWFADKKKHILLEKPMALTVQECYGIYESIVRNGVMFAVGHVLRYSEVTQKTKQILNTGGIGKIINIQHLEPVGYYHFAHSYVRGNWRDSRESSFSLMTKSCHDIDWLCYVMNQNHDNECMPNQISSFGSLLYFNSENKPDGAADRCLDCPANIENNCAYSAKKIYLDRVKNGKTGWPVHVVVEDGDIPDIENVTDSLRNSNYGKCVFSSDNDVVDNQVVQIQFNNGTTCSFTMVAFTKEICERNTRIHGTVGQIELKGNHLTHTNFLTGNVEIIDFNDMTREEAPKTSLAKHGYADYYLIKQFVEAIRENNPNKLLSNAKETLHSHLAVFAAEDARLSGQVVNFTEWLNNHQPIQND
jgi:predicted dehydrogenase